MPIKQPAAKRSMRWLVPLGLAIVVALFVMNVFDWEDVTTHRSGRVLTFEVGMDKLAAFEAARDAQVQGLVTRLLLLDATPTTHDRTYRGDPILEADRARVTASDRWHLGIPDRNAWLVLEFADGKLHQVEEHTWTGPTE